MADICKLWGQAKQTVRFTDASNSGCALNKDSFLAVLE